MVKIEMISNFYLSDFGKGHLKGFISIYDHYNIVDTSATLHQLAYGEWDPKTGLKIFEPSFIERRSNFHGHELK